MRVAVCIRHLLLLLLLLLQQLLLLLLKELKLLSQFFVDET